MGTQPISYAHVQDLCPVDTERKSLDNRKGTQVLVKIHIGMLFVPLWKGLRDWKANVADTTFNDE